MNYEQAAKKLAACGQGHVLDGWKKLSNKWYFFREDGTAFFTSIAHEGECILTPRDSEDVEGLIRSGPWTMNRRRVY